MKEEDFIQYEEAVELKQLGFDESCFKVGNLNGHIMWKFLCADEDQDYTVVADDILNHKMDDKWTSIPLYSQTFKWFREKHNLHAEPVWDNDINTYWFFCITKIGDIFFETIELKWVNSYEKAELECLKKLIEIVKK